MDSWQVEAYVSGRSYQGNRENQRLVVDPNKRREKHLEFSWMFKFYLTLPEMSNFCSSISCKTDIYWAEPRQSLANLWMKFLFQGSYETGKLTPLTVGYVELFLYLCPITTGVKQVLPWLHLIYKRGAPYCTGFAMNTTFRSFKMMVLQPFL